MYIKDFDGWNLVKNKIHSEAHTVNIRAGEVRWITLGVNIGSEVDGKGSAFTRPALILHVMGVHLALIVPMSTSLKHVPGYVPFWWHGRTVSLCIHQLRVVSIKRILGRQGKISDAKLRNAKKEVVRFFSLAGF